MKITTITLKKAHKRGKAVVPQKYYIIRSSPRKKGSSSINFIETIGTQFNFGGTFDSTEPNIPAKLLATVRAPGIKAQIGKVTRFFMRPGRIWVGFDTYDEALRAYLPYAI